jgi:curli biogenesis system outer membrane secretion channel CsgG
MKRSVLIAALISATTPCVTAAFAQEPTTVRPTMAVADFETDRTGWMPPPRLGATIAEMLTDRLVTAGQVRMIDRLWLTGDIGGAPASLAKLIDRARDAGVDFLVAGSVTRLSIEKHSSSGGGLVPLPVVGGLFRKNKTESVIGLTVRVVDVRTGEVVATATAEKGASQRSVAGGGLLIVGHVPIAGGGGSSATGFQDGLLDTALQEAVTMTANELTARVARLAAPRTTR